MNSYHEVVQSRWFVYAPYLFVSLLLIVGAFLYERSASPHLWVIFVVIGLSGILVWFSEQYRALSIDVHATALTVRFGSFSRIIPLETISEVGVTELRLRDIRRLGIFKGRKREMWLTRTGKSLRLTLQDGKEFFCTSNTPEAAMQALRS